MKTAREPGVHSVHDPPATSPAGYPTRIRKQKRRVLPSPSAPPTSRGRTRASDLRDPSSGDSPSQDASPSDNHNSHSPPSNTSPNPSPPPHHNNSSNTNSPPPDNHSIQKHSLKPNNSNKNDKKNKDNSPTLPPPSSTPSSTTKSTPWRIDEIVALAKQVLIHDTTDPPKLFAASTSDLAQLLPAKNPSDIPPVIHYLKTPLDSSRLSFAPKCGVSELAAALASQHSFLSSQKTALAAANEKHAKAKAGKKQTEKSIDKLKKEAKKLKNEIHSQKRERESAIAKRDKIEVSLTANKRKLEKIREEQLIRREDLAKAKLSELEMRRRLDRMRLKVAALRGQMITPTVDKLLPPGPKHSGTLHEDISAVEHDALLLTREGVQMIPSKRKCSDKSSDSSSQGGNEASDEMDIDSGHGAKTEQADLDEDSEETQLRLLRNRLAMCENEALEWADSLESAQESVRMVGQSKARLEEEMGRFKQPSSNKSGSGGRGVGKGSVQNARNAAKLRAAARAAFVAPADLAPKKMVRKSRKSRPRKSLVPY